MKKYLPIAKRIFAALILGSGFLLSGADAQAQCTPPPATITGTAQFCAGDTATLVANTGSGYTYQWLSSGFPLPGEINGTLQIVTGGSYSVIVSNAPGCSTTSPPRVVTMTPAPTGIIVAAGPTSFCVGDSVQLCAAPVIAGQTYQWKLNNVTSPTQGTCIYAKTTAGYTLRVVNGATGCSMTTSSVAVTVNPKPTVGLTRISPSGLCNGDSINIHAYSDPGYSYQWTIQGMLQGFTDSVFNLRVYTFGSTTPVVMSLRSIVTNSFGCKDSTAIMTTTISPRPNPAMTYSGGVLSSTNTHAGYVWNLDGAPVGGATGPTHVPVAIGVYTLTAVNNFGCDSTSAPITINGVGVNNVPTAASISIFPNPANNVVTVKAATAINIVVKDMQGRVVLQQEGAGQLNLSGISTGIYAISIFSKNGELLTTQRLLKKD